MKTLKTIKQIQSKAATLQKALINKAAKKGVYENFGDSEERKLCEFIGCIYDYPTHFTGESNNRSAIDNLLGEFREWCMTYNPSN